MNKSFDQALFLKQLNIFRKTLSSVVKKSNQSLIITPIKSNIDIGDFKLSVGRNKILLIYKSKQYTLDFSFNDQVFYIDNNKEPLSKLTLFLDEVKSIMAGIRENKMSCVLS
ncbi:MAG: hypothetical protein VW378_00785 [bacterium]